MPPATGTHRSDFGLCLDQSAVGIPVLQVGEDVKDNMVDDYMKKIYDQIAVIKNKLTMLDDISLHNLVVLTGKYYNLYHLK